MGMRGKRGWKEMGCSFLGGSVSLFNDWLHTDISHNLILQGEQRIRFVDWADLAEYN